MPEDLQALIDRLQRDAVDEGQRRARVIIEDAEAKAAASVREAEAQAAALLEQAERDARAFTERSVVALDQAGRDLLIAVSQSFERMLDDLVHDSLTEELRPGLLAEMLVKMAEAYGARSSRERRTAMLLNQADLDEMVGLYAQRYRDKLAAGVELRLDNSIVKGFRLSMSDDHIEHDFTIDAIAEALGHHLRPRLAEILPRVAPKDAAAGRPAGVPEPRR